MCPNNSLNCTQEWYKCEAMLQGQSLEDLPSCVINPEAQIELDILQQFSDTAIAYDIVSMPTGGDNVSKDVIIKKDSKLSEGLAPI